MSFSGNIGEWSEAYALFKILADGTLAVGDKDLQKITQLVFPVIKILRTEKNDKNIEYTLDSDIVVVTVEGTELCRFSVNEFASYANQTFNLLKQRRKNGGKGAFELPEIAEFLEKLHCRSLKASSSVKTDITLVIHDPKTNQTPALGFSIKSQLGGPSTLLNAGKTTNFVYRLQGMTRSEMDIINAISSRAKIKDRLNKIRALGIQPKFVKAANSIFSNNLTLIDSQMPRILAEILVEYYNSAESKLNRLVDKTAEANPLEFDTSNQHRFYDYKIKRLLTDIAVGLMPGKIWNGIYDATGGYLIIKDNGDVLCYHLYNRNEFEDYLINNTKLETASSSRHDFGKVYEVDERYFINLNLQIRFLK